MKQIFNFFELLVYSILWWDFDWSIERNQFLWLKLCFLFLPTLGILTFHFAKYVLHHFPILLSPCGKEWAMQYDYDMWGVSWNTIVQFSSTISGRAFFTCVPVHTLNSLLSKIPLVSFSSHYMVYAFSLLLIRTMFHFPTQFSLFSYYSLLPSLVNRCQWIDYVNVFSLEVLG